MRVLFARNKILMGINIFSILMNVLRNNRIEFKNTRLNINIVEILNLP